MDLEFGTHSFLMNHVVLKMYQDANFKTCLSLFGWKENILPKEHILHCYNDDNVKGKYVEDALLLISKR